ncbi:MAG: subtype II CRISPR-associated endonuclease Cas1 [Crocinitomicaceae bacterium]|nr:subtype II CRISPR-associated endonuclease Cas1 [Crocinitomicaceae bacterium]|tara:strand:- start:504 stop:1403 length:900 start_codon:yes stop_codon:yes gene_type:complete
MIKRTLYFGTPAYLKKEKQQLKVEFPEEDKEPKTVPIEDVGMLILDHPRVTVTQALLSALMDNNAALLSCDDRHLPGGLFMPMTANHVYTEKLRYQLEASEPLRKNLWQQTVKAKILNQAAVLSIYNQPVENMHYWAGQVKSGDPDNYEGRAAANYWKRIMDDPEFRRGREEPAPNNLLNYGYAVLRAIVARSLVSSGMLPAIGIHHSNKYNPFCLADDIMEPYRPYVDLVVLDIQERFEEAELEQLTKDVKRELLIIPTLDIEIEGKKSPLMVGMQRTTASLMQCFEGVKRKIAYPLL